MVAFVAGSKPTFFQVRVFQVSRFSPMARGLLVASGLGNRNGGSFAFSKADQQAVKEHFTKVKRSLGYDRETVRACDELLSVIAK